MIGVGFLAGLRKKWVPSDASRHSLSDFFPPVYVARELERMASDTVSLSSSIHLCLYLVRVRAGSYCFGIGHVGPSLAA